MSDTPSNSQPTDPPEPHEVSPAEGLRQALRQFASGVTVVTAQMGEEQFGITVSAFSAISLDPPIVMVAINRDSSVGGVIAGAGAFAVHILSHSQRELSERFASDLPGMLKYDGLEISTSAAGAPVLRTESLAVLECRVERIVEIGTHNVVFGLVEHSRSRPEPDEPLLYYHRAYRLLASGTRSDE